MLHNAPTYIRLTKLIKAPREKVYGAWLDPQIRKQWWCATPQYCSNRCEIDPTVGGRYRINMEKDGEEYVTVGQFIELDRPNKLAFTWSWEKPIDGVQDTKVTVELYDTQVDGYPATELVLTHEKLNAPINRQEHNDGWTGCLQALAEYFKQQADTKEHLVK